MTYAEFFQEIKSKFMGTDVSTINEHLAYQFCIDDSEAGGIFYVEVKDGQLYVEPYEYYDKDANFIADVNTFRKIAEGKLDPVVAYTSGKLRVEGNIDKALMLKDVIELKKKQEKKEKAAKKTTSIKSTVKKTVAKKETAKKETAKKTTTKKTTAKKTTAKKAESK
jgi:putative sterol carrier protein